jgi:hypothetical protein
MTAAGPAKAGAAAAPATRSPQQEVANEDRTAEQRNMAQEASEPVHPGGTTTLRNGAMAERNPTVHRWIKTDCGRAKYQELATRQGAAAKLRLAWFVAIAALRDWPLPPPPQPGSESGG